MLNLVVMVLAELCFRGALWVFSIDSIEVYCCRNIRVFGYWSWVCM